MHLKSEEILCKDCQDCGYSNLTEKKMEESRREFVHNVKFLVERKGIKPDRAIRKAFQKMFEKQCRKLESAFPHYQTVMDAMDWASSDLKEISITPLQTIVDYMQHPNVQGQFDKANFYKIAKLIHNYASELSTAIDNIYRMAGKFYKLPNTWNGEERRNIESGLAYVNPELREYLREAFFKGFSDFREIRNDVLHSMPSYGLRSERKGNMNLYFGFDDSGRWKEVELFGYLLGLYSHVADGTCRTLEYMVKPK